MTKTLDLYFMENARTVRARRDKIMNVLVPAICEVDPTFEWIVNVPPRGGRVGIWRDTTIIVDPSEQENVFTTFYTVGPPRLTSYEIDSLMRDKPELVEYDPDRVGEALAWLERTSREDWC